MRIKSINISNFLSYENANIEFNHDSADSPKIYVIDGMNLDSGDDGSNGSGKSSLVSESVFYNIYGRGLRGSKQRLKLNDMVRHGADKMSNTVKYYVSNGDDISELTITRTKVADGGSTTSLSVDGDEKTKRIKRLSDKDIKLFVDMSPDVFSQVVMYYKDNITLLEMNYGQRLDFFKTIIDLSVIDDYYIATRDFKIENEKKVYELELKVKNIADIIEVLSKDANSYIKFVTERISKLKEELAIVTATEVYDTKSLNEQKEALNAEIKEINNRANEIQAKIVFENKCASKIKDEAEKIEKLGGADCPVCKQFVDKQYVSRIIDAYSVEIDNIVENVKKITVEKNEINALLAEKNKEYSALNNRINEAITSNRIRQNKIVTLETEIKKLENDLNAKSNDTQNVTENKKSFLVKLEGYNKALETRRTWQADVEYWYEMFAPKSLLRSAIIKQYIAMLSDTFEYYISSLYNDEIIGRMTVNDDGQIDIILYKDGYEANYWQLSSGEKKRISIALMLSLYEFTSMLNNNMPKFIVADEIFDSLDNLGRISVMETLIDVQKRHNIDLFLISHIDIPVDSVPENIEVKHVLVTKKDKISSAKIVD